jgi:hypothetical protein
MSGILNINGVLNYLIVNQLVDVRMTLTLKIFDLMLNSLGCFACFCPWCMGCKLAKHLGESTIIGCCPGSLQYFRTKLRTARRIEVRRYTLNKSVYFDVIIL